MNNQILAREISAVEPMYLIEMLQTLDPFQQLLLGVSSVGVLMIVIVIFLTSSPNFENTDRFKKILDSFEKKN